MRLLRGASGARVTLVLVLVNAAVYAEEVARPAWVLDQLGMSGWAVAGGEYHRLLTAAFVHLAPPRFDHLALNLVSLCVLGWILEPLLGRGRFLLLYLLSGIAGSVVSYLVLEPGAVGVGASGPIFGLLGGLVTLAPRARRGMVWWLLVLAANLVFTFAVPGASWPAHLGGAVLGLLLTPAMVYPKRAAGAVTGLAALVLAGALVGVVGYQDATLAARTAGINGVYAVDGVLRNCSGSFSGCALGQRYRSTWTVSGCVADRCTISARGWAADPVLTRSRDHWRGVATRAAQYSSPCRGVPIVTNDNLDLTSAGDGALNGTLTLSTPPTGCKPINQVWSVTATRTAR